MKSFSERVSIGSVPQFVGKEITLTGWIHGRRDHGKIIFLDIRDRSSWIQSVATTAIEAAKDVRLEAVVMVKGLVKKRPPSMVDHGSPNGAFELEIKELEVLNYSREVPLPVDSEGYEIKEEVRMEYRYLDLRRPRLQKNLMMRSKIMKHIRDFLEERGFWEIETPNLTRSTPEGARDYLVPSRLEPGKFYALPQSPQQYKQLLMMAGVEKYFQIARCFRDEDTRGDRQPEFTQLDLEMSFVDREDVMALNEKLLISIVEELYPEKKIQELPFPRLTYAEAMSQYGTDRPDLRRDKNDPHLLAFAWVIDFPFFEKGDDGRWTFTHNPFSAPLSDYRELLQSDNLKDEDIQKIITTQYDIVLNGFEIGGGSIRAHERSMLEKVLKIIGYPKEVAEEKFGHMLKALDYGAPPHGGIAWGFDRLVAILQSEPNIREVIAFPKTGDGRDLLMHSPSEVDQAQLKDLGLDLKKKNK
ncbi:MAG: aspartate--tRNA ligase [Anaplasmataceae bacterium]|nr:aspartate--tRNA ligase [Anaplasmataceae bacterium]